MHFFPRDSLELSQIKFGLTPQSPDVVLGVSMRPLVGGPLHPRATATWWGREADSFQTTASLEHCHQYTQVETLACRL